jgi:hypothetical protein
MHTPLHIRTHTRARYRLPARKADNLTAICEPIVHKMWETRRLTTLWASTASYRDSFISFR